MSIGSPKKGSKCEGTILAYKKNKPGLITVRFFIAGFHSRDQQPCFSGRKRLHNNRVKFPEDLVGAPTWRS